MASGAKHLKVLLVDNEPALKELFHLFLAQAGHTVVGAESANAAHALWSANAMDFDLLVTDYFMPGKKGDELVHDLCAESPSLKCLIVTGHPLEEIQIDPSLRKRVAILQKPVTQQSLIGGVDRLMAE